MSGTSQVRTPVLDKMLLNKPKSQAIGEFLEWCGERGYVLASYGKARGTRELLMPVRHSIEQMLAEHFEINPDEAERERQAILASLR